VILYKKRRKYKYNLKSDLEYETGIQLGEPKSDKFLGISTTGTLQIKKGYSWDGPSGPTIDTKTFMQGALIHDALYQLMREGILPQEARKRADVILRDVCIEDDMFPFCAWVVYYAVRIFGACYAKPDILEAP